MKKIVNFSMKELKTNKFANKFFTERQLQAIYEMILSPTKDKPFSYIATNLLYKKDIIYIWEEINDNISFLCLNLKYPNNI